ncbi:MAG: 5-(carboxyamino)imidazole ribonucleotide synthase [Alphaproteobacteria bacterium]
MINKKIGIIGGGQLGMFICEAAKKKKIKTIIYSDTHDFSAKRVCDDFIVASYDDKEKINEFVCNADFFTVESENIPIDFLKTIEMKKKVFPSSRIIEIAQNRLKEKKFLNSLDDIETVKFFEINDFDQLSKYASNLNYKCILKTQEFGYDGKGQFEIKKNNLDNFKNEDLTKYILEEKINFDLEISVIIARSSSNFFSYPPVENVHKNSILRRTIFPARINKETKIKSLKKAEIIAKELDFHGVLAIEMFILNEKILINEIAPRPHNSGHWTMDASGCSQFENLVSIITNGNSTNPEPFKSCEMINIIGDEYLDIKNIRQNHKVYDYSKPEVRPLRKMGHYIAFD